MVVKVKYVSFSFDDGRLDTFINAAQVMDAYGIKATINVVTDFVENPQRYRAFMSADNKPMSIDMIVALKNRGYEIACHGHTHSNKAGDILLNIKHIKSYGIDVTEIGFASPFSYMTQTNCQEIMELLENKTLGYIRSGIQIHRESLWYKIQSLIISYIASPRIFARINSDNCFSLKSIPSIIIGISITEKTTSNQIKRLLEKMPENYAAVLIFHSVLKQNDPNYGKDKWYIDVEEFDRVCKICSEDKNVSVLTTKDLLSLASNDVI